MKKLLCTALCALSVAAMLSACGSTDTGAADDTGDTSGTDHTLAITYSNLVDEETREEVSRRLLDSGVSQTSVDRFMALVADYNTFAGEQPFFKDGFTEIALDDLDYDTADTAGLWTDTRSYADTNCRITGFGLFEDMITADVYQTDSGFLMSDIDAIDNYPACSFTPEEKSEFLSIYDPVPMEPTTDSAVVLKAFQDSLAPRGITFQDGSRALVSVVINSELDNTAYVGHTGVLLTDAQGLLFIEKYGPTYPYQATKFDSTEDLKAYLEHRFGTFYTQGVSAPPVYLINDQQF